MITDYFSDPATVRQMRDGPLGCYLDCFADHLRDIGYCRQDIPGRLRLVSKLGRWLPDSGDNVKGLDEAAVRAFELAIGEGARPVTIGNTLRCFLAYMRGAGVIPEPFAGPVTELACLGHAYGRYLMEERGLAACSVKRMQEVAREFLDDRFPDGQLELNMLTCADVTGFVLRAASRVSPTTAGLMVTFLRSFLRYLHVRGDVQINLAEGVPTVANRQRSGVPRYIEPGQVQRVLRSCDRKTVVGRRDYAALLVLSRLGLRGGELVRLALEDIDWELGELRVRGRPGRTDRLPLPGDVGEAIAAYLRNGRPGCRSRHVFVRARAPYKGFATTAAICDILRRALKRAGLNPPRQGSYLFRHSVATTMLHRGAALSEIGELLRHRHPDTTAIYAKVDLTSLRRLALPWPGVRGDE